MLKRKNHQHVSSLPFDCTFQIRAAARIEFESRDQLLGLNIAIGASCFILFAAVSVRLESSIQWHNATSVTISTHFPLLCCVTEHRSIACISIYEYCPD